MAKYDGKYFRGVIGAISFRNLHGRQIAQRRPGRGCIRQSMATKASSGEFGRASSIGALFRRSMRRLWEDTGDGGMVNRLTSRVAEVIRSDRKHGLGERQLADGDTGLLKGFEFNERSRLAELLGGLPAATLEEGKLKVSVDGQERKWLKAPAWATGCELRLRVVTCDLASGGYEALSEAEENWTFREGDLEGFGWEIAANVPEGSLVLAGLSLRFYQETGGIRREINPQASAAVLLGVFVVKETANEVQEVRQLTGKSVPENRNEVESHSLAIRGVGKGRSSPPILPAYAKWVIKPVLFQLGYILLLEAVL